MMSIANVTISGIKIDQINKTEILQEKNAESLPNLITNNFIKGLAGAVIGNLQLSSTTSTPNTRANIARMNGVIAEGTVDLTANKTEILLSSCSGGGFSHPIDFHYHYENHPIFQEYLRQNPKESFA